MSKKWQLIAILWVLGMFGFCIYAVWYNWFKTTPEQITDPNNWIFAVIVYVYYAIGYYTILKRNR